MVKKIITYCCILIGLVVLTCASLPSVMTKLLVWNGKHAFNGQWWGKNNSHWGDLTKMAMLDDIPKFKAYRGYVFDTAVDNGNKNIELYLFGDSHTEDVPGYVYANLSGYHYGKNTLGLTYTLDPTKHNILLIESTERFVRGAFEDTSMFSIVRKDNGTKVHVKRGGDGVKSYSAIINKNLDYVLFDYNFINAIRRAKADMNYKVFHRASGDVSLSDDGQRLFFKSTVVPYGSFSSYAPLSDSSINTLVSSLNSIYDHYRKEGFEEVYFSIIPSPATIMQPQGYNMLIPRVRGNAALHMPYVDIYDIFKASQQPDTLYRMGDTHWSNKGLHVWLQQVNDVLRKKSAEISARK